MFFKKTYLFVAFVVCSIYAFGQDKPQFAISKIDTALLKDAESVIRFEETSYNIISPREYVFRVRKAVTIFNEDSDEKDVIAHYDQYSDARILYINLYDASGKFLRKVKKSEIFDTGTYDDISILHDSRVLAARVFGGQLPYTLEYEWQISFKQTFYYDDWMPLDAGESVETATFILETPADLVVHTKALNHDFIYEKEVRGERIIQKWTLKNKEALTKEESGPPDHELLPMLLISPSVFQINDYTGSMSDWKSFGAFMHELNKGREKVTPEMAALVKQMTAHCKSPQEKIDTLYHWLQKNMRYVSIQLGIGGWQSFDAPYVEKNRFGDCKALSTFMKGMLAEAGIESWQVLIKWDEEDKPHFDDFTNVDFNHMMLHVPGENMWLECTSNYLPAGIIDKDEENKKVLLITPDGGVVATTPSSTLNSFRTLDTIRIAENVTIKGLSHYEGNAQRIIRHLYFGKSNEELKEFFLEEFPVAVQKLDAFNVTVDHSGSGTKLEYKVTLPQYGSESGGRYFIPVNSIHPLQQTCSSGTVRKTDFISKEDVTETNDIYLEMPADYTVEYLPPKTVLEFKGNKYSLEVERVNNYIHIRQQLIEAPMRLAPKEYYELCSYYDAVVKSNSRMIVLKKLKT